MVIEKQCPFCSRIKALDLFKIVGEVQTCECGALYVTDINSNLMANLRVVAAARNGYDSRDPREGIEVDEGAVYLYLGGRNDAAYLAWTRRVPNMQEVRNGFRVETGDWLKNHCCCCCEGQIKITGIFPMDTGDMICWACENYTGADGHESGNFTVANSHKLDFLPSRVE